MSNAFAPLGLRPVKSEPGETRENYYKVSSASAQIYEGDVLEVNSSGLVQKSTGTTAITALGVAGRASGVLTGQIARFPVYDDPGTIFVAMAQASNATANIGTRVALNQGTATNQNGVSVETVDVASTSTSYPLLVLGFSSEVGNDTASNNAMLLVKIASHLMNA